MTKQKTVHRSESSQDEESQAGSNPTIGQYEGNEVSMSVRRKEDVKCQERFAVNVYVSQGMNSENDSIVRIDNSHGEVHIDRLYLPEDDPCRKHDEIDVETANEAIKHFVDTEDVEQARWKEFTKRYDENHGL